MIRLTIPAAALALIVLSACDAPMNLERTATLSDAEVCGTYGDRVRDARRWNTVTWQPGNFATGRPFDGLVPEIQGRGLIRGEHMTAFLAGRVTPGMTGIEALCTWGRPEESSSERWVFKNYNGPYTSGQRTLEFGDGIVVSVNGT